MRIQPTLYEGARMTLQDSLDLSLQSLNAYGANHRHWAVAYSGGKDSSATVTFVAWAIRNKLVPQPESLTVLYADTRMELPPLQQTAMRLLDILADQGIQTKVVLPALDERFFVYMFGRGVPPPKNRFRWCTPQIKVEPMLRALSDLREQTGEKILMLTGVRMGESAARDARIALSCSKDSGECGQGWFQTAPPGAVADTLAPLLHWRLCHVYDWLYFEQDRHGYDVSDIALIYGDGDVRTGCVGCNLASQDVSLKRLIAHSEWSHLAPLLELRGLYAELTLSKWRKRKSVPETLKSGALSRSGQRKGPLTMGGRRFGLDRVLDIQKRARVDLINAEEHGRILQLIAEDTWPRKWSHDDMDATVLIDRVMVGEDGNIVTQALLVR